MELSTNDEELFYSDSTMGTMGSADIAVIENSIRDTLTQLRLAIGLLDQEVTDLTDLKRVTVAARSALEERRVNVLKALDAYTCPIVHFDNQLLQVLETHSSIETGVECHENSRVELSTAVPSQEHDPKRVEEIRIKKSNNDFHDTKGTTEEADQEAPLKTFYKFAPLLEGDEVVVILVSFEPTGHFRGRRAGDMSRRLFKLYQLITKYFEDNIEAVVKDPQVGSACIVKLSMLHSPQRYHRARVENVNSKLATIGVFLVDVGERTNVKRESVLDIPEQFLKLPETALMGKFGAVIPRVGPKFCKNVLEKLKSKLLNKEVVLRVTRNEAVAGGMEALLYEVDQGIELCINSWIVVEGDAYFTDAVPSKPRETIVGNNCLKTSKRKLISRPSTYSCQVIKVVSPASIFVRKLSDQNDADLLAQQMNVHFNTTLEFDQVIFKRGCLAAVSDSESWERVRILKVIGNKVWLFLLDKAEELKTVVDELKPLPVRFTTNNYTMECHLSGIIPNTNRGSWSKGSTEVLRTIIKKARMIVDVENDGKAGHGSQPVKIFADHDGPANRRTNLAWKLVHLGYASNIVQQRQRLSQQSCQNPGNNVFENKQLNRVENGDDEVLFLWPEPFFPEDNVFDARASYVDWDGVIYLMTRNNQTNVKMINDVINDQYLDSSPAQEDLFWRVGEAAIVRWQHDNKWYRGRVLRVLPNHCQVKLVDYGTETFTPFTSMRKRLVAEEIPIQSIPFMLDNISPIGGLWTENQLTIFHELVVDKDLTISNIEVSFFNIPLLINMIAYISHFSHHSQVTY